MLDETDLTITEVAFAAGFGSVRQFNRACREVFRESPRALRARRRKADRLVADGGLLLRLPFSGPLDWDAILAGLALEAIPGVESVTGRTYRRTILLAGDPGVLELLPGEAGQLLVRAHLPHWEELVHVVRRARRIASLDLDLDRSTHQLATDPALAPLLRARVGLRPAGCWNPFEAAMVAIISQYGTSPWRRRTLGGLVERLGAPAPGLVELGLAHTFPPAVTVAQADLRDLGLAADAAHAIGRFAAAVVEDRIRLDGSVFLDQLIASITAIDGIAARTAHRIALRLGESDAFPVDRDVLERVLLRASGIANSPAELSTRWQLWRALVATHLLLADGQASPDRERPQDAPAAA